MEDITDRVKDALNRAKANGYTFDGWATGQIALDLMNYDSDFENEDFCEICEAINAVRAGY